jgi:hypothetical protein
MSAEHSESVNPLRRSPYAVKVASTVTTGGWENAARLCVLSLPTKAEGKVSARHKGYRLPHGTLTARQAPIEWEVDEATLMAWAEATDPETLVRVKKARAWNVIKPKLIPASDAPRAEATMEVIDTRTGEVRVVPVPGVWVKPGPREVFTPKPALDS